MQRPFVFAGLAVALSVHAQVLQFEVASIRASDPSHVGVQTYIMPGQFIAKTAPLKSLVCFAFGLMEHQVSSGINWAETEPFDVTAKADEARPYGDLQIMVRNLLAERFQLKFHRETKEQPIYSLVLGNSGPKLKEVKVVGRGVGMGSAGRLNGIGSDMKTLASVLSRKLSRSVVDRTELAGFYDFVLTWTPDEQQAESPGPSIFTAIQEQLGLKLVSTKGPVEILVIDRAERPSAN